MSESAAFSTASDTQSREFLDARQAAQAVWQYVTSVKSIQKRDGRMEDFQPEKLERALARAFADAGMNDAQTIRQTTENIVTRLHHRFDGHMVPSADEVRETVSLTLIDRNLLHVAKRYLEYRGQVHRLSDGPVYNKGITVQRFYTQAGIHPYDQMEWEKRDATITNEKGKVVFEQKGVEVPKFYSQTATNIIVSKYFRGRLNTPDRETSVRQLMDRVAKTISTWGRRGGYFATEEDAATYEAELTSILVQASLFVNSSQEKTA